MTYILSRAPSFGGVRTWVEGLSPSITQQLTRYTNPHTITRLALRVGRDNIINIHHHTKFGDPISNGSPVMNFFPVHDFFLVNFGPVPDWHTDGQKATPKSQPYIRLAQVGSKIVLTSKVQSLMSVSVLTTGFLCHFRFFFLGNFEPWLKYSKRITHSIKAGSITPIGKYFNGSNHLYLKSRGKAIQWSHQVIVQIPLKYQGS